MPVMLPVALAKTPSSAAAGGWSSLYHAPVMALTSAGLVQVTVKSAELVHVAGVAWRFWGAPGGVLSARITWSGLVSSAPPDSSMRKRIRLAVAESGRVSPVTVMVWVVLTAPLTVSPVVDQADQVCPVSVLVA